MKFQNTIEKIRFEVGSHLMQLLFKQEGLLEKLKILKDYFLLGDGQFFQIFVEESQSLMILPPNKNTEQAENEINHFPYANTKVRLGYD